MVPPQMRRAAASSRPPFPRRPPAPRARPDGRDASYMASMMALANPLVGTSVAPSV